MAINYYLCNNYPEAASELVQMGADLAFAQLTSIKVDRSGYGEGELSAAGRRYGFSISEEGLVSLSWCDEIDFDERAVNEAIDWEIFNSGKLCAMIRKEWENASGGPFYDFFYDEYEDECEEEEECECEEFNI